MFNFLFDTHFHIDNEKAPQAKDIFQAARSNNVLGMILQATSMEDCDQTQSLTVGEKGVFATAGLHPHVANDPYDLGYFREFVKRPKIVAIGEIGLDYFYDFSERQLQRKMFEDFLELAIEVNMPAVIHSRDAFEDSYAIVKSTLPKDFPFEIHSYSGELSEAEKWLELGAMMSLNGMVTFKKSDNIRALNKLIPDERLLLETDSPYLAPVPLRGQENTPANIPVIAEFVAKERGVSLEEITALTTKNAMDFFHISELI